MHLLVALYFPELETDLKLIKQAGTELDSFIEQLWKKDQSPAGYQDRLKDF
jgi:hypothetical protein